MTAPGPDELALNRAIWTAINASFTDADAAARWAADEITWGLFAVPERTLRALGDPERLPGLDVVELGCGTAYLSAWLGRRGARPVAVDLTPAQLATARRCQQATGPAFPLVQADAAAVPLADGCADLVLSEHGASVWCDPQRWLAEAARLLRPGGRLAFLTTSVLAGLTVPEDEGFAQDRLLRPQRGPSRVQWPTGGVEYHPSHGEWVRLLRDHGFTVEALHELYAPEDARTPEYYVIATAQWAKRWPVEDLWVATRSLTTA